MGVQGDGALHFPPDAIPKDSAKTQQTEGAQQSDPLDHRWQLDFHVNIRLQRPSGNDEQEDRNDQAPLKVYAEELVIGDDAQLIDSWLSRTDVLKDIELLLETKLKM